MLCELIIELGYTLYSDLGSDTSVWNFCVGSSGRYRYYLQLLFHLI